MSKAYTVDNLLSTFPLAMSQDKEQIALATATANALSQLYRENRLADVYTRIDELDETLCDILAYDYKIDWYMWSASLAAKRQQIKSHFEIHRHLGTSGAVKMALRDICPGTELEEWYEYGGKPYYFRVIIDLTEPKTPIKITEFERMLRIFKSVRSVLEPDKIILRSRCAILMSCESGYTLFTTKLTGTYPYPSLQGRVYTDIIDVTGSGLISRYPTPMTNQVITGTVPKQSEHGQINSDVINVSETGETISRLDLRTNCYPSGTVGTQNGSINFQTEGAAVGFDSRFCGSPLDLF